MTVTAAVNSGYKFVGWYSGGVLVSNALSYTFTALGNITLEARFRVPAVGEPGTQGSLVTLSQVYGSTKPKWTYTHGKPAGIILKSVYQYRHQPNESYVINTPCDVRIPYGTTSVSVSLNISGKGMTSTPCTVYWYDSYLAWGGTSSTLSGDYERQCQFIPYY